MKLPLTPRRTFTIYGLVLAALFVLYLSILSAGQQRWVVEKDVEPARQDRDGAPDAGKPMMEFYEELAGGAGERKSTAGAGRSSAAPVAKAESLPGEPVVETSSVARVESPEASRPAGPRWVVQVGAFTEREQASQTLLRVQAKGLTGRLIEPSVEDNDPYFRVWVGRDYQSAEEAKPMEQRLSDLGISHYTKKLP